MYDNSLDDYLLICDLVAKKLNGLVEFFLEIV